MLELNDETRNKIDDKGNMTVGKQMPVADYLAVKDILKPLWDAIGPDVARKVKVDNHVRLFDAAKVKVRAWEAAHAKDDVWNLPPSVSRVFPEPVATGAAADRHPSPASRRVSGSP